MPNKKMIALGENRSVIRDLFEYGLQRKKIVGEENVYALRDFGTRPSVRYILKSAKWRDPFA